MKYISISPRQFDTLDLWTLFNDPAYFLVDSALAKLEIIFRPFRNRHIFASYFVAYNILSHRVVDFIIPAVNWSEIFRFRFDDLTL